MNKKWIKAALVRAAKTMAQTALGMLGASALISEVDWKMVASASILAGIASILTSIVGLPEVKQEESEPTELEDKPELPDNYYEEEEHE